LSVAFTRREWEKRRFFAISDAENVKCRTRPTSADFVESRTAPPSLPRFLQDGTQAAEVPFESATLGIRGRLDLVSIENRQIILTDFKSGRVTDLEGKMNEQIARQLRLYGLALHELAPEKDLLLRIVSRGGESIVRFDEAMRIETSEWLAGITDALEVGTRMSAAELAVIGPQCARCDVRPICPGYLDAVGELWKRDDTAFELPLDTAGTVVGIREQGPGLLSVKIVDHGDRTVKIHRLSAERMQGVATGQALWLFDLASIEAKMLTTGWRHPRNFHEMAMLPTDRTAWTMRMFFSGD
jgi:hypothetical protein